MADFVTSLVEMGFESDMARRAVDATGNIGVEQAMEWILSHSDGPEAPPSPKSEALPQSQDPSEAENTEATDSVVRSYKCEDCGKHFKNETEMEFHAAKTQHSNFSESTEEKKPLTAQEKTDQLKRIEAKLKEKRAEREAREKADSLEKEKLRMKSGKELLDAKRRIEEQQMKEIVDARRREKLEDKAARDRVRAQIEADKVARRAKQTGEQPVPSPKVVSPPSTPSESTDKKEYKETKIQLRLPSGKVLKQSFGVQEPLSAVRLYVEINRDDGITGSFNLMSTFPRKVYEGEDYDVPLDALGLVPSAVLMVTKG